jgi:hypothetical protein
VHAYKGIGPTGKVRSYLGASEQNMYRGGSGSFGSITAFLSVLGMLLNVFCLVLPSRPTTHTLGSLPIVLYLMDITCFWPQSYVVTYVGERCPYRGTHRPTNTCETCSFVNLPPLNSFPSYALLGPDDYYVPVCWSGFGPQRLSHYG